MKFMKEINRVEKIGIECEGGREEKIEERGRKLLKKKEDKEGWENCKSMMEEIDKRKISND